MYGVFSFHSSLDWGEMSTIYNKNVKNTNRKTLKVFGSAQKQLTQQIVPSNRCDTFIW